MYDAVSLHQGRRSFFPLPLASGWLSFSCAHYTGSSQDFYPSNGDAEEPPQQACGRFPPGRSGTRVVVCYVCSSQTSGFHQRQVAKPNAQMTNPGCLFL